MTWPIKGQVGSGFASGATPLPPPRVRSISESVAAVHEHARRRGVSAQQRAVERSAFLHARIIAERDLPDPDEIKVDEGRKGQMAWQF